jgi:Fe-S-cluster containining protein
MNRRERRAAASGARRGVAPEANPVASRAAELHRHVLEAERRLGDAILAGGPRSPQTVHELVDGAVTLADSFMQRSPTSPDSLACKRGCDHCCHRPVITSAPTVLQIAADLREKLGEAEFATVLARVVALDEKTHGAACTVAERPPHACAFLVDGACSIYAVRPFVCRAWNSADAEACRRALGQDTVEMRFDLYQRTTFAGVEKGLQEALRAGGLDASDVELTAAVRVAMENPDACERWLAGEPVFADCEAKPDRRRRLPFA